MENGCEEVKTLTLYNDGPIGVNFEWKITKSIVKTNEREPLRIRSLSKSQNSLQFPKTDLKRSSSVSNIDALHISEVFSMYPSSGFIQEGESLSVNIKFTAHSDISASCVALCCVTGGLDYAFKLNGESSTSDCYIESNAVVFGDILIREECFQYFSIYNAGKVPCSFSITHDLNDMNLQVLPMESEVPSKGNVDIRISVEVQLPREFSIFAKVHLKGKRPIPLRIHGRACFPHLMPNLPRVEEQAPLNNDVCRYECEYICTHDLNLP